MAKPANTGSTQSQPKYISDSAYQSLQALQKGPRVLIYHCIDCIRRRIIQTARGNFLQEVKKLKLILPKDIVGYLKIKTLVSVEKMHQQLKP